MLVGRYTESEVKVGEIPQCEVQLGLHQTVFIVDRREGHVALMSRGRMERINDMDCGGQNGWPIRNSCCFGRR